MAAIQVRDASLLSRLLARIEAWASGSELDRLGAEELRCLARDVGLEPGDLTRLVQQESDASRLLYARLESLGLTMGEIEARGVGMARDMERTCGLCADRALCEHDLAERPDSPAWRRICPNNWTFDEMERMAKTKA